MTSLADASLADWTYETDYRFAHVGGLKVDFSAVKSGSDPAARATALGDYVDGTVVDSRERARAGGVAEIEAVQETRRLFDEATLLFRTRPAGSAGAPRSLKRDRMSELVERRRKGTWEPYGAIAEFHGGRYECDHVSPFSKAAGNLDSPIVVLLLDWATRANLSKRFDAHAAEHGYSEYEPTTARLKELLLAHFRLRLDEVYATNLFPFVRTGQVPSGDLRRAALEYALPQIEIVAPRLVICLGGNTFNALRQANGRQALDNLNERLTQSFAVGECGALVWSQAHTGYWGQKRGAERVAADWNGMAEWFRSADVPAP